jgi:hypothetical protein
MRAVVLLRVVITVLVTAWCGVALAQGRRVLLAIGSNVGIEGEPGLQYAERDAKQFAEVMMELGGVAQNDAHLLPTPTPGQVRSKLSELKAGLRKPDTLLVYFSGHGTEGELHLGRERMARSELELAVDSVPAHVRVMFIDACRGQKPSGELSAKGFHPTTSMQLHDESQSGLLVVQSAAPGQVANESGKLKGGVFSHHIVRGLRGAADRDGDRRVSLDEAYHYAYYQTRFETDRTQSPERRTRHEGSGFLLLTQLKPNSRVALLGLPAGRGFHYDVYTRDTRIAVASAEGAAHAGWLGLWPGPYVVSRQGPKGRSRTEVVLVAGDETPLGASEFRAEAVGSDRARGLAAPGLAAVTPSTGSLSFLAGVVGSELPGVGFAADVGYALGGEDWFPGVHLSVSRQAFSLSNSDYVYDRGMRYSVGVAAGLERRFSGSDVGAALGGGLLIRPMWQSLERRDSPRSERPGVVLGAGPFVKATIGVPLTNDDALVFSVEASPMFYQQGDTWVTRGTVVGLLGVRLGT